MVLAAAAISLFVKRKLLELSDEQQRKVVVAEKAEDAVELGLVADADGEARFGWGGFGRNAIKSTGDPAIKLTRDHDLIPLWV